MEFAELMKVRGFKVVHQNIQSLGRKIDQLRVLLCQLNSEIQLIILSETWLKPDATDKEYEIPGYKLFRKDREAIVVVLLSMREMA